jgi:chemotaxis signal transduction protein
MIDLIVFSVGNNRYALNIENIQRIIQATEVTNMPNSNDLIDGMLSYEGDVIKVLNFRKLIGMKSYDNELHTLFLNLKEAHNNWFNELRKSLESDVEFTKTFNPHKCELGVWLDEFNSYDEEVTVIIKDLMQNHKLLHILGRDILELKSSDIEDAKYQLNSKLATIFNSTMKSIDLFIDKIEVISNSLQKFIIYENSGENFAIKVDIIDDIAHMDISNIMNEKKENNSGEFLELYGVLDLDGILVNIIKQVKIPN